jgi:hypothetical protein
LIGARAAAVTGARASVARAVGFALVVLAGGCTIEPAKLSGGPVIAYAPFSHAELDAVLKQFVDADGLVDYAALKAEPLHLERYYYLLARYSPDSHPEYFPAEADRLAYWLNAYNAGVLTAVIRHYPIASVTEVAAPVPFRFVTPRLAGFFVFERVELGGRGRSFRGVENRVIRKRFGDPRVHFVLTCAAMGCPRLRRHAFAAGRLDEELERASGEFLGAERNVRVDDAARIVHLSEIFDRYEKAFVRSAEREGATRNGSGEPTVLDYLVRHAPADTAAALERAAGYEIRFTPFDWRLNDRPGAPAEPRS